MNNAVTISMNECCNWVLFEQVQEHPPNVIWRYKQRARASVSSKQGSACWAWVSNKVSNFKYVNMCISTLMVHPVCWTLLIYVDHAQMFYIGLRDSPMCSTYQSTYLETLGQNPLVCITLVCGESTQRSVLNKTYCICAITTTTLPSSLLITGGRCAIFWQYYASVAVSINICFTLEKK